MRTILKPIIPVRITSEYSNVLILGRYQRVEGTELALQAAISFLTLHPLYSGKFLFVGSDSVVGNKSYKLHLLSRVPADLRPRILFTPAINRMELTSFLNESKVCLAIVPSFFAAYLMAAHELCKANVPLLISDIPAFQGFFPTTSALHFRSGDVTSLVAGMTKALIHKKVKHCAKIPYSTTSTKYQELHRRLKGNALKKYHRLALMDDVSHARTYVFKSANL